MGSEGSISSNPDVGKGRGAKVVRDNEHIFRIVFRG